MKFTNWLKSNWQDDNMFPPSLSAQEALYFLKNYLLGKDWYVVNPLSEEQINVELVNDILLKYSKEYRKEYKRNWRNK